MRNKESCQTSHGKNMEVQPDPFTFQGWTRSSNVRRLDSEKRGTEYITCKTSNHLDSHTNSGVDEALISQSKFLTQQVRAVSTIIN